MNTDSITTQGVLMLADIYGREGDNEQALELLERRARLSSSPEDFTDAIEQYRRLIAIEVESPAMILCSTRWSERTTRSRRDLGAATAILDGGAGRGRIGVESTGDRAASTDRRV